MPCNLLILMVALALFSTSGCAKQLQQLNSALSTASGKSSAAGGPTSNMPAMSDAQFQALHTALARNPGDQALARAKAEAEPTIEKILKISSCYSDFYPHTVLRQYSAPEKSMFDLPINATRYHPRNKCLTVTRLDSWKMLARNAFSFRATFVSEESGESAAVFYEMRKQPEGEWLMR